MTAYSHLSTHQPAPHSQKYIWSLFATSYASQHLATSFTSITLIVLLREQGVGLDIIGLFQMAILPYSLRFLWSPVVEYYGRTRSAHFKNWLLVVQWLMVLCLIGMAWLRPDWQVYALFAALTVFAFIIGTQDVALDGLACSMFDGDTRTIINSIQVGSGMVAGLVAGGLIYAYPSLGWQGCLFALAAMSFLPLFLLYRFREQVIPRVAMNDGAVKSIAAGFVQMLVFWVRRWQWLVVLALYACVYSGSFTVIAPALVDNGWQMEEIGIIQNYGTLIGLVSVFAIIPLIARFRRVVSMRILTAIQLIALACVLPLANGNATPFFAYLAMTGSYLTFAPMFTMNSKTMMDFAAQDDTPATIYSTQTSLAMLISIVMSSLFFTLAEHLGYQAVLFVSMAAAVVLLVILPMMMRRFDIGNDIDK